MTIEELRIRIDALDRQLVELLSERARAAQTIGNLKAATSLPVYEPEREKTIYANVRAANKGPLPDIELTHIYERIIDVMRALQKTSWPERNAQAAQAEGAARASPRVHKRPRQGRNNDCRDAGESHRRTNRCRDQRHGRGRRQRASDDGSVPDHSGRVGPTAGLDLTQVRDAAGRAARTPHQRAV